MIFAVMIPSRQAPDPITGYWVLLEQAGRVPAELVWDNEAAHGPADQDHHPPPPSAVRGSLRCFQWTGHGACQVLPQRRQQQRAP
jgi:hypothetical protein